MVSNHRLGVISIKKRMPHEWMVLLLSLMPLMLAFLTEFLNLPSFFRYLMDLLVIVLSMMLLGKRYFMLPSKAKPMLLLILLFFIYLLIAYLFNYQSVFYFIWGTRNTFRFYLAFLVFVAYVTEEDANLWFQILDILFWLHFAITIYQFVVYNVRQDMLGGIFGIESASNGYNMIFLCIVISETLLSTFEKEGSFPYCIAKCFAALAIAAMAEMKFFYFIFILILVLTTIMTRPSRKKVILLILMFFGVVIGASLLTFWFDEFAGFLSWENLWETAFKENYSSQNDVNRLSAIFTLSKSYVTEPSQQLFGLGLGNCDVSDLAIFNSTFYQAHSFLHYNWFTSAMLFLETGFIGLITYISFFVLCIVFSFIQIKRNTGNKFFCQMAIIMSILSMILIFYNASLRIESGYMVYFVLALPFLASYEHKKITINNIKM